MDLFGSYSFSGEGIVRALSWTLLHSLWQGVLLALVAGATLLLTKKAKPSLRYNLLVASILLFIIGAVCTFINQLDTYAPIAESNLVQTLPINKVEFSENLVMNSVQPSTIIQTINFINTNAIWIVSIWLLIIFFKFISLSTGLYKMYQLKNKQVSSPSEYWNDKINELCQKLKINKKVELLQSGIVTIPSVVGYFKPVILFPAAMLTALPVHEVEAILIHELGHIRRNDFVVNLLQNILEMIFFFNPAVLWVSSLIKTERENCCDDIAVSFTGKKQDYIKALINFLQFEQQETQQIATAFSGEKNHILNRAKRIIYNKNNALNIMEKKFLSASFVLVSICLFAFVSIKAQDNKKKSIQQPTPISKATNSEVIAERQDEIPVYKIGGKRNLTGETNTTIDGKEFRIIIRNSVVTQLYIDGNKIPAKKIIDYKPILDRQFEQMVRNSEKSKIESEQSKSESEPSEIMPITKRIESIKAKEPVKPINRIAQPIETVGHPFGHGNGHGVGLAGGSEVEDDRETFKRIIEDVIANDIVKNRKQIHTFKFNADELVVNGVKQPTALHEKFKSKYVTSSSWSWAITTVNK